ncbi:membrane glycoprotein UL119 [Cercopithecine betaherpesvirus 5]|uniref:Membrane glycoprotein UL119 n=2 Tax=Simian cytomegalovirus (strain Colburn) TaxID=50292 RepID=G8XU07_SCMVC|nr:membrane glycoprotein UL119 [Cercopithecine betaherpesvirus 5]
MLGTGNCVALVAFVGLIFSQHVVSGTTSSTVTSVITSTVSTSNATTTPAPTTSVTSSAASSTTNSTSSKPNNNTTASTATSVNASTTATTVSNTSTAGENQTSTTNTSNATATPSTTPGNASDATTNNSTENSTTIAPATTTNRTWLPDINITCESAYSYNYLMMKTMCKISNIDHLNVTRDLISIECFQQVGCNGNLTSFGSITSSNSSEGMNYNSSTAYFTLLQPTPNVTTRYTCKFIARGQTVNKTWEFMNVPIKAFFASPTRGAETQLRLLVNDDHACMNYSMYRNTTAYVYINEASHPSYSVRNITRDNQMLWEYIFLLNDNVPDTVRLRMPMGNTDSVVTYIFLRRDPDAWPVIGTLGYVVLGFILFMLFALMYITYILMRQQNPWAYQRLDEEKAHPMPYFK